MALQGTSNWRRWHADRARSRRRLDASESKAQRAKTQVADLGRRLNLALAQRVQDLSWPRPDSSGGCGRSSRGADIQVVGDRFCVSVGSAVPGGRGDDFARGQCRALDKLATAIKELAGEIPAIINGFCASTGTPTSARSRRRSSSNWELSAARAIAVTKYLVANGVSAQHLVAAGFGDSRPIDTGETEEAYAKNRRIESADRRMMGRVFRLDGICARVG